MRPLNNMFENYKNNLIFISFPYTFLHECLQKSFCLSNADYFGPKTNINLHIEVDGIFFSFNNPTPLLEKSEKM